jgi:RNA polymerase sigma-70 factor (ECF subfamily)
VVVKTIPEAGLENVAPGIVEIKVTFSKEMTDNSWSWSTAWQGSAPEVIGKPRYEADGRTCVLKAKLEPGTTYGYWLNSERFKNFKDRQGRPAVPYLLAFRTADQANPARTEIDSDPGDISLSEADKLLNDDQRSVIAWTHRQFRGFFDARSFDGWPAGELANLEKRLIDTLNGPVTREYYQAINTLAALGSTNALPRLRELAFERRDKNNRDRWMSLRALGLMGDTGSVPEMIHLVYHGNVNTRWWAQISLVRLTGQNFGNDWRAWAAAWNDSGRKPGCSLEIIRWWDGQPEPEQLADSLAESDRKFLSEI